MKVLKQFEPSCFSLTTLNVLSVQIKTQALVVSLYPEGKTWWFLLYLSPEKDGGWEKSCLQFDITHPIKRPEIMCHSSSADSRNRLTAKLRPGCRLPRLGEEKDLITSYGRQERKFHFLESSLTVRVHAATPAPAKPMTSKRLESCF